jgi:hypothetical protein
MTNENRKSVSSQSATQEIFSQVFIAASNPTHNKKWAAFTASDAPIIRAALLRAQQLRTSKVSDVGDAYLQGIADAYATIRRQTMLNELLQS